MIRSQANGLVPWFGPRETTALFWWVCLLSTVVGAQWAKNVKNSVIIHYTRLLRQTESILRCLMKGTLFTILAYCAPVVLGRPSDGDNIQRFWHLNETGFIGVNGTWSPAPLPPTLLPPLRKTAVHSVLYVPAQAKKSAKFGKLFVIMLDVSVVFFGQI